MDKYVIETFLFLIQALKTGKWVVLDELNLASQSVLEVGQQPLHTRVVSCSCELLRYLHLSYPGVKCMLGPSWRGFYSRTWAGIQMSS
jgi:hypothetical protein